MPIFDTEKIINGTDTKRLIHAHEELKNQYSDDLAKTYSSYYIGKPLSFLLKNARYILSEPQIGLPFMKWTALKFPISYAALITLKDGLEEYIDEYKKRMHPSVLESYESSLSEIRNALKERSCEGAVEGSLFNGDQNIEFFDNMYGELCKRRLENGDPEAKRFFSNIQPYCGCDNFNEYVKNFAPGMVKVIYGTPYAKELCIESELCESYSEMINENGEGAVEKAKNLIACETVQMLSLSERFLEAVNNFTNSNLRCISKGMIRADIGGEIISTFKEASEDTINPVYTDSKSAVNAIMEESVFDELYKEERERIKTDLLSLKKDVYESVRNFVHNSYLIMEDTDIFPETDLFTLIKESMGVEGSVTVESAMKIITEAVSEIEANNRSFFEATGDGSANKVIKKSHEMFREGEKVKNSQKSNAEDDDIDVDDDTDKEIPKSARVASHDFPDSSNPNAANSKPKLEKPGIVTSIQNKALDLHKNSRKAAANLRKAGTGIKNAGKAVLKIPSGTLESLKGVVKSFDEMDDNRRKQYMLQPGYRKKIFKNLRVAAMYGLAGYTHALLIPITWLGRKLSKEKNKRIRNEFSRELDTEIKVCDSKIEDATANGDQEQKYRLIRLRDQLAREKERVSTNGKYI